MYALLLEPCLCLPRGQDSIMVDECFCNVHENNKASFVLFRVGIDVCLEALASRGVLFPPNLSLFVEVLLCIVY